MVVSAFTCGRALCFVLLLLNLFHPSVWGKAKLCRWSRSPRQGELCDWKLAELLYTVPAGHTTSSLQSQAGAWVLAEEEDMSQGQERKQQCMGSVHHRQRRDGAVLSPGAERMLWTWDYVATTMKLDFPPLHKGGQNDQSFRQQSTILVRLLKRSMLDWKAKRLKMGGCNKHEDREQEGPSAKSCWPTARKPSICESNRCVTHTWW